jgi:hypothetical protein
MLTYHRDRAGLSPEQLGTVVFMSGSLIRKVEAGTRTPAAGLVKACDDVLGCNGALAELYGQLRPLFRDRPYPGWFGKWPEAEAAARSLRWYEPLVIPGLLQTEDYARAILSTRVGDTADEIDEMVAARLDRQQILSRDKPPTLWVIVDEGVLHRDIGGPAVMADQAAQLSQMARRPGIVVQVIPLTTGAHQGLNGGAFIIADIPGSPVLAYQDTAARGQVTEDGDDTDALVTTWDTLKAEALPRAASLILIEEAGSIWTA